MSAELDLAPGRSVALPAVTVRDEPDLRCLCIRDTLVPFVFRDADGNILLQGTVQDRVGRSRKTGCLHFYHRVKTMSGGSRKITEVWRRSFTSTVYVGWRPDGLGTIEPVRAVRAGETVARIKFYFTPGGAYYGIPARRSSRFFYIKTEATDYNSEGETILVTNASERATIQTAQPIV